MKRVFLTAIFIGAVAFSGAQTTDPSADAKELKRIQGLEKQYLAAKAAFAKSPKDKKKREAFIKAATVYGHENMVSGAMPPQTKYKRTLEVYREVLKLEPNHPVAKPEHDLIVRIYKSMGRPVPN
jgi:hypothetical protein